MSRNLFIILCFSGLLLTACSDLTSDGNSNNPPAAANNIPVAVDDSASVSPNSQADGSNSVDINVLQNDQANTSDGTLTIGNVSQASQGTATLNSDNRIHYQPDVNVSNTTDTFTYTVENSVGETATATVTVTIAAAMPTAAADSFTVAPDSTNNPFDVLDNDSANTAGSITITQVTAATLGTVSIENGTLLRYTPNANIADQTDTFEYTITNQDGETSTATVVVAITNNAAAVPDAVDDTLTINQNSPRNTVDVLANDTGSDGSITLNSNASTLGVVRIAPDGQTVLYDPPLGVTGMDSFSYTITNGSGLSDVATVTVTINGFNPAQMQFRPCEAELSARMPAGRPYCIDVGIPSGFDDHTIWATVFVPAQAVLDGATKPPVILHAHGFGESRFASLENPNSFMKFRVTAQALLALWHEGYWVITYDQRGFNASGLWGNSAESSNNTSNETCVQPDDSACIDVLSPEREARDATVVMDWIAENLCQDHFIDNVLPNMAAATAPTIGGSCANNMPLYAEDAVGDPVLGSIGLSYGGGWQTMGSANDKVVSGASRSNNTRINAMVPVTTWYDLRTSLAHNDVPKSGWLQFLTGATQTGGTTLAANGFLAQAGNEALVQDSLSAAVFEGLYIRSMSSYAPDDGSGELLGDATLTVGDDTFVADNDLQPALGNGVLPTNDAGAGPDVFIIQGQRDILFGFNEAYYIAQAYQTVNPASDVRMLIQTEGHILATAQAPSYKDAEAGEPQIIYIDETVSCDAAGTALSTAEMIADWFREKLGPVDGLYDLAEQTISDVPTVCVTHYLENAAPETGRSYTDLDDVTVGGSASFTIDSDSDTAGDQAAAFVLPSNPPINPSQDGIAPPPPVYQQELVEAGTELEFIGIPTADLTITASGLPELDPPRFFMGFAVDRGNGLKVIADYVTPISGPVPAAGPSCLAATGCTISYSYPRDASDGLAPQLAPVTERLAGFGVKLAAGDKLVLVIYDQFPVYNLHGTTPGAYQMTVSGSVNLPLVP